MHLKNWLRAMALLTGAAAPLLANAASPAGDHDDTSYPDIVMQAFEQVNSADQRSAAMESGDKNVRPPRSAPESTASAPTHPCECRG